MKTIHRSGFTLVDVLASAAVLLVGGVTLQPVLEEAKTESFDTTNRAQHQRLAQRQGQFIASNDGQFTGANVTGWLGVPGPSQDDSLFVGDQSASTPTQTLDWITPLLGDELGWSPNRARRTQQLLEEVRDPRNPEFNDALFGFSDDAQDFIAIAQQEGYRATSYLAPAAFQFWGTPEPGGFVPGKGFVPGDETLWMKKFGGIPYNWSRGVAQNIDTPRSYRPRIENVGAAPSQKAMFADGTRYVVGDTIDIEIDPTAGVFGNFASGFFASEIESSYGRLRDGVAYSARRPGLRGDRFLYITYFDGSTRASSLTEAKSRPDWWAPSGSVWTSMENAAPEADALYDVGDVLP